LSGDGEILSCVTQSGTEGNIVRERYKTTIHLLLLAALCTAVPVASGQTTKKQAWEWTNAERIAARTNPALMRQRVVAHGPFKHSPHADPRTIWGEPADVLDGQRNPELFLPEELFQQMILHGYVGDLWRDAYAAPMQKAGLPVDIWETLEPAIPQFIDDLQRRDDLQQKRKTVERSAWPKIQAEIAAGEPALCRHRSEALATARRLYGVALDRFLYDHIARSTGSTSTEPEDPRKLQAIAGGCR
jgi:hypothetical protein